MGDENANNIGKGLLRAAVADLLPPEIVERAKSMYPGAADVTYAEMIRNHLAELLRRPDAPMFDFIDHGALRHAFQADSTLPGFMAIQPSPMAPAAFLLDLNDWLTDCNVRII